MSLRKNCWEDEGWIRGDQLKDKEGNQGHTFLARKTSDPENHYPYILKRLKRQEDKSRRALFCNEVQAMAVLNHSGILRIESSNAINYLKEEELYLIVKKANGKDLVDLVKDGLEFSDAVKITIGVLGILEHCHSMGVLHRDIKPCHVITDPLAIESPVLIDFGIAYNEGNDLEDARTKTDEGKGNRFLIGPEHLPGVTIANRNASTDICQCMGLLYYCIYEKNPGLLNDHNDLKPHRREDIDLKLNIDKWQKDYLLMLFDRAFEWHPDRRWIDIPELKQKLGYLLESNADPDTVYQIKLNQVVSSSTASTIMKRRDYFKSITIDLLEIAKSVVITTNDNTKEHLVMKALGTDQNTENITDIANLRIDFRVVYSKKRVTVDVIHKLDSNKISVYLQSYTGHIGIEEKNSVIGLYDIDSSDLKYRYKTDLQKFLLCAVQVLLNNNNE
jgi:serine/threonine protein kinase